MKEICARSGVSTSMQVGTGALKSTLVTCSGIPSLWRSLLVQSQIWSLYLGLFSEIKKG